MESAAAYDSALHRGHGKARLLRVCRQKQKCKITAGLTFTPVFYFIKILFVFQLIGFPQGKLSALSSASMRRLKTLAGCRCVHVQGGFRRVHIVCHIRD